MSQLCCSMSIGLNNDGGEVTIYKPISFRKGYSKKTRRLLDFIEISFGKLRKQITKS